MPKWLRQRTRLPIASNFGQTPRLGVKVGEVVASFYEIIDPLRLEADAVDELLDEADIERLDE